MTASIALARATSARNTADYLFFSRLYAVLNAREAGR